jgi:hypothetical protein
MINQAHEQPEKSCSRCKESYPADRELFYRDRRSPDGLRSTCKACYSELPSVQKRHKEA